MLLGGDEFGRSQGGNNNAYCQDNPISWFDWELAKSESGRALSAFVGRLTRLRAQHATLHSPDFMHGGEEVLPGVSPITWFAESGAEMTSADWNFREGRLLMLRRAQTQGKRPPDISLLLVNGTAEAREFTLPTPSLSWRLRVDSAKPAEPERMFNADTLEVSGQSVVLLTYAPRKESA
jgi:glycogen operon protein